MIKTITNKKVNKTKKRSLSKIPIIHMDTNDLYKAKITNMKKIIVI